MANNKNEQQDDSTIEKLNANLTGASERIAQNKKAVFLTLGITVLIAAIILCYVFFFRSPKINRAFEAYHQVEISAAGNDSVAAVEYKKVADKYSGTDAGKLAALSAAESFYNTGKYKEAIACLDDFSSSESVLLKVTATLTSRNMTRLSVALKRL